MKTINSALLLLGLVFLLGCGQQIEAEKQLGDQKVELKHEEPVTEDPISPLSPEERLTENQAYQQGYQKPGAAIRFTHNYDGEVQIGEIEEVTLSFRHSYQAGSLHIELNAQEGLEILDDQPSYHFDLADKQPLDITTSLAVGEEGKYYLSIFATVENEGYDPISRVFALALNAGDPEEQTKSSLGSGMSVEKAKSGEKIILMPAEETISP